VSGEDPALGLPEPPRLAEPLGSLDDVTRAEAGAADDLPFLLAGRRARVAGGTRRGADGLVLGSVDVPAPRLPGAAPDGATITPIGVERRLRIGSARLVERVLAPRDGAFVLFEWALRGGAEDVPPDDGSPVLVTLEWPVPPGARWRRGPRQLVSAVGGAMVVHAFSREPGGLEVGRQEGEPGTATGAGGRGEGVSASFRLDPRDGLRLAIAAGPDDEAATRALRAANRTRAHVQARRGEAERLRTERLSLESPDPDLDAELEWVKVRLAASLSAVGEARVAEGGRPGIFKQAADALVVGDAGLAVHVLSRAGRSPAGPDGWAGPVEALILLAADYLDRTGDLAVVRDLWLDGAAGREAADASVSGAALRRLARIAEEVGDREAAARLTAVAARTPTDRPDQGAGVVQDDPAPDHDPRRILDVVRKLVGDQPDATRQRLVLRPRPPRDWDRYHVRSIPMGDASFSLQYSREGDRHRFTVRQERGAVPAHLILEPDIPGRFVGATVDGTAAELETRVVGARIRVPVQLDLDHERVLEVEMSGSVYEGGSS
jgi:hypothetical protein